MAKTLTAQWLLTELQNMKALGTDLSRVELSYRFDPDSEVEPITYVGEGIYDAETNNILEEIIFMTDASEYED
jgi:hypothetical protein